MRWLKPVRPGDTLRLRSTVIEAAPSAKQPNRGTVLYRWETLNQNGEVALLMMGRPMFLRRTSAWPRETESNVNHKYYWEDFYLGQVLESGGYSLSDEEMIEFARKYDPQPFHIDSEKAKQTVFGGLIASGWQTASICMRLMCDQYVLEAGLGSPGVDELRWVKPVRPGDTLRLKSTVLETRASASRPDMGMVRVRSEVYNQHGELVMHMSGVGMFRRRGPGE